MTRRKLTRRTGPITSMNYFIKFPRRNRFGDKKERAMPKFPNVRSSCTPTTATKALPRKVPPPHRPSPDSSSSSPSRNQRPARRRPTATRYEIRNPAPEMGYLYPRDPPMPRTRARSGRGTQCAFRIAHRRPALGFLPLLSLCRET